MPDTYYEKSGEIRTRSLPDNRRRPPTKRRIEQIELAEKAKIQNQIAGLIPQPDTAADNRPLVTVNTFHRLATAELPGTPASAAALDWFSTHWSTLGMVALALFSLLMLRAIVRSVPPPSPPPELNLSAAGETADEASDAEAEQKANRLKRRQGGQSLREELVEIVREDPDTAANILRGWIGNAS